MERADEVLALGQVHAGLATDRAVDHREQRGGDVHDVDAAVVHRRREPGGVADDSPTDRDDEIAAEESPLREAAAELLDRGERLGVLSLTDQERSCGTRAAERGTDERADVLAHLGLRYERDPAPAAHLAPSASYEFSITTS